MCNFFSCILLKDRIFGYKSEAKVLYDLNTSSHEDILRANNVVDDKVNGREFVRIEVTPRDINSIFSRDRQNWYLKVDEAKTIPEWYENNMSMYNKHIWDAWEVAISTFHAVLDMSKSNELFNLNNKIDNVNELLKGSYIKNLSSETMDLIKTLNVTESQASIRTKVIYRDKGICSAYEKLHIPLICYSCLVNDPEINKLVTQYKVELDILKNKLVNQKIYDVTEMVKNV